MVDPHRWFRKAEVNYKNFLTNKEDAARHVGEDIEMDYLGESAYNASQCAEKWLKGVCVLLGAELNDDHKLARQIILLREKMPTLLEGIEAYGVTLAKYNTLGRYPDDNRHFSHRDHASAERALTHIRNEMIRISLDQKVEFLGYDYIDYNSSRNDTRL